MPAGPHLHEERDEACLRPSPLQLSTHPRTHRLAVFPVRVVAGLVHQVKTEAAQTTREERDPSGDSHAQLLRTTALENPPRSLEKSRQFCARPCVHVQVALAQAEAVLGRAEWQQFHVSVTKLFVEALLRQLGEIRSGEGLSVLADRSAHTQTRREGKSSAYLAYNPSLDAQISSLLSLYLFLRGPNLEPGNNFNACGKVLG